MSVAFVGDKEFDTFIAACEAAGWGGGYSMSDLRLELDVVGVNCMRCGHKDEVENTTALESFVKKHMAQHFTFADFSHFELLAKVATPGKFNGKFVTVHWRKE